MPNVKSSFGRRTRERNRCQEIDLTLAVLCVRFAGRELDYRQISRACGLSHGGAYMIAQAALKKVRNRLRFGTEKKTGRELAA